MDIRGRQCQVNVYHVVRFVKQLDLLFNYYQNLLALEKVIKASCLRLNEGSVHFIR
jgi:hypothetical protein